MNYEVHLVEGNSKFVLTIQNVNSINHNDNVYYLYNEDGETLFTAPFDKVITIVRR